MISLQKVNKTYEVRGGMAVNALEDVDLEVQDGEFLVIVGRSGSGKTTLLNVAAGLSRPTAGKVIYGDTDLWSLSDKKQSDLRNRALGFVFQFPSLIPTLTAVENVMLPLSFGRHAGIDGRERARELMDTVGLGDRTGSYPRQLSAGQQQRVVIARALMNKPEILFADEPSSDLDDQTEAEIMGLFADIHESMSMTILMVTHARELISFGTRAVEMNRGRVEEIAGAVV
jgi:ABC-type lipoprotein export system ATPase subunit